MFERIKYLFIGIGIFSLIAIFYITGQKFKINKLKSLLTINYNKKVKTLTKERTILKKKLKISKGKDGNIRDKISELDKKRKEIKKSVKIMDKIELSSAIDAWIKSRQ